jgi:hypothetical protein
MLKNTFFFSLFWFVFGCSKPVEHHSLELEMDVVIQKTDSINIYYSNSNSIDFNDVQSYWLPIKGSKKNQKIRFVFPDSIQPKQIRIDFGRNKKQPEIILNKITFSYKEKNFSVKGEEIYHLFRVDESNTTIDKLFGSLKRKQPNQKVGPSLYPKGEKLFERLNQLYSVK